MRLHQMKTGTSNARWQGYRALGVAGAWTGSGHAQDMNMRADQDRSVTGRGEDKGASKEHTRARKHEQQSSRRCPASALARGAGDFGGCTGDRGGQQWLGRGRLRQRPALRAGETVLKTAERHWHGGARLGTKGGRRTRREVHGWKWSMRDVRAGGGWVCGRGGRGSPRLGRHARGGRPRAARASHSCGAGGWRPRWVGSNREPALSMSRACRVTTM